MLLVSYVMHTNSMERFSTINATNGEIYLLLYNLYIECRENLWSKKHLTFKCRKRLVALVDLKGQERQRRMLLSKTFFAADY